MNKIIFILFLISLRFECVSQNITKDTTAGNFTFTTGFVSATKSKLGLYNAAKKWAAEPNFFSFEPSAILEEDPRSGRIVMQLKTKLGLSESPHLLCKLLIECSEKKYKLTIYHLKLSSVNETTRQNDELIFKQFLDRIHHDERAYHSLEPDSWVEKYKILDQLSDDMYLAKQIDYSVTSAFKSVRLTSW